MTTRATTNDPWGQAANLGPKINSSRNDSAARISPDGLELYFSSNRPGGHGNFDAHIARRATANDPWGDPVNLGPIVNSPYLDVVQPLNDLVLLIASTRPGGYGGSDWWMSRRASVSEPWETPMNLGPTFNSAEEDCWSSIISFDPPTLWWADSTWEYYQAPIVSTVDLNGDGKVDIADVFIMLEHWHTNHPLGDIGPMPWGDGIVDAQDLIVLAEHMANNPGDVNDVNKVQ